MTAENEYARWLASGALTESERAELEAIRDDPDEVESRFGRGLEFGTAGLRGVMGMGTNRMNIYIVRHATQAFAETILAAGEADKGAAVCHDCRHNSREFAEAAACVFAANGIPVRIFEDMRPTPELSFAVREYGCAGGVNITASHNPKEYNGYKVYGADGAQLGPDTAAEVKRRMDAADLFTDVRTMPFDEAAEKGLVTVMGAETDEAFLQNVCGLILEPEEARKAADRFTLVYTPFHGVGRELVPEALRRLGLKNIVCEPKQMVPDGDFPTVASPNPENLEGFALAADLANEVGADLIIGTDPDSDRVAVMAKDRSGKYAALTGNQAGVLLIDWLIGALRRTGRMPENPVVLKTIVTTEMARAAAERNGVRCLDTFTGFKFMAAKKNSLEAAGEGKVIFSFEESIGYMAGDFVRDKDAVTASLLLAEMAVWYHNRGMTLIDALESLFEKYGYYGERTVNLMMPGLDGPERMARLMSGLRADIPREIAGTAVGEITDYLDGTVTDIASGRTAKSELSGSDVLRYALADGTVILVRPSGTEPKIKVYVLARGESADERGERIEKYGAWAESLAQTGEK